MNYLNLLNDTYDEFKHCYSDKFDFIGTSVFDFTTYEDEVMRYLAQAALQVCTAISKRKTFDFIATPEGNITYLTMVNMKFFDGKLEWGTSIRGAWWDLHGGETFKLPMFSDSLTFNEDQWSEFIEAMVVFLGDDNDSVDS